MGGGAFEIPQGMGVYLGGTIIEMWVKEDSNDRHNYDELKIFWKVYRIKVYPETPDIKFQEKEVIEIIKEAFQGLGTYGIERSNIVEVTVDITADIEIV